MRTGWIPKMFTVWIPIPECSHCMRHCRCLPHPDETPSELLFSTLSRRNTPQPSRCCRLLRPRLKTYTVRAVVVAYCVCAFWGADGCGWVRGWMQVDALVTTAFANFHASAIRSLRFLSPMRNKSWAICPSSALCTSSAVANGSDSVRIVSLTNYHSNVEESKARRLLLFRPFSFRFTRSLYLVRLSSVRFSLIHLSRPLLSRLLVRLSADLCPEPYIYVRI